MPFIKVYIHLVWSTKNREPFLSTKDARLKTWQHIKKNSEQKGIFIDCINGHKDHCHCLVSLSSNQTIEKIVQLLKGESSYWINKDPYFAEILANRKFGWQDEYFAVSVSESILNAVRNYIKNQEEHHRNKTFQDEYDEFVSKFNFKNQASPEK